MIFLLRPLCLLLSGSLLPWSSFVSVEGLFCYECTVAENSEFCNVTASTKSCEGEDICISQKIYNERDGTVTSMKGCLNYTACQELERGNDAGCREGRVQDRCSWCCSTDFCNHDGFPDPSTATEAEQTTVDSLSNTDTASPGKKCPTSDELARRCVPQFRNAVESVMSGEADSFSKFCRSIPEIFRCFSDATASCQSNDTSGKAAGTICPLWEELRRICPMSCNESVAKSCVLDVFESIVSAFTFRSNSICQELMSKIRSGYQCVSRSVSSCEDGRAIMSAHNLVLRDLESAVTKICPRLPSVDNLDIPPSLLNRVGLAPCQLEEGMKCISTVGNEIIRARIEEKSFESICDFHASNMSFVRTKTESCFLVRRKRSLLATEVVSCLLGNACDRASINPVRCNTTAARLCITDLLRLSKGSDVQQACNSVEETKSCVKWKTEKCTEEEKVSLNRTLEHVLLSVADHCTQHFQCLSNETIVLMEGGGPKVIQVQVTYPPKIICSIPGCQVFLDIIPDNRQAPNCRSKAPISQFLVSSGGDGHGGGTGSTFNLCSRLVMKVGWKEVQSFYLAAKTDFKYDNSQLRSVRIAMRKVVNGTLVERRTICKHKVLVLDGDRPSTCQSVTDPHITTFDGRAYNNFLEGFFTLYRHRSFPYEVQVAFQRCVGGGATCNCAVAVRAGDSVFFLDKCRRKESPAMLRPSSGRPPCRSNRVECTEFAKTEIFYHGKITPGFRIFTRGDHAFEVLLPHGTRVVIRGQKWFNIYIYPSPFDWNSTEGLCGTYDGRPRNDLTLRSGRLWRESLAHRSEPPLDFSLDWRVPENQLLVRGVAKAPFRLPVYCDCDAGSLPDGVPKYLCSSSRILELCDFNFDGEITYKLPKGQQEREDDRQLNRVPPNRKRKRQTSRKEDESSNETHNICDFDLSADLPEVTQTGNWTKDSALQFCRKALFDDSKAVNTCCLHLSNFNPDFGLESCAEDLMYSGDTAFVDGALEILKSQCSEQLAANVSFYNSVDGGDILLEVEESLCVEECGQRGICLRGRCFCEEGYAGSDCRVLVGEPPQSVALLNGGLCDQRRSKCNWSVVLGQTFLDSTNLSCRLQQVELLDNATVIAVTDSMTIGATYISSQQVLCPIGDVPGSYLISVSNDGATFSDLHLFQSRDVACYDCARNASKYVICRRKANTCLVAGTCYTSGEESRDDPCLVCDPAQSTTHLYRKTSTKCTSRTLLTVAIVILALLFCAVVVLMAFRRKRKDKRSVEQLPSSSDPERVATSSKDKEIIPRTLEGHDNVAMEEIRE